MTRPFSLQPVLELMQSRADDATRRLAQLIAAENDARSKLELLQQYRSDYATRFQQAAGNGLSPAEWRNFQDFLGRIDEAIEQQGRALGMQKTRTAAGQAHWQEQRVKLKALDTLSERHRAMEMQREARQEQKQLDEFAARSPGASGRNADGD